MKIKIGDLETIVAHYKAIPILIEFIKKQDNKASVLHAWDKARCEPQEIQININIDDLKTRPKK